MSDPVIPAEVTPIESVQSPPDDILVIKLQRKEKRVCIQDENGVTKTYYARELLGTSFDQWRNTMADRMRIDKNGIPSGIKEFKGLHASLIARCLYDENNKLVSELVIAGWPATSQKTLFELCQKLNGLTDDKENEEDSKKS